MTVFVSVAACLGRLPGVFSSQPSRKEEPIPMKLRRLPPPALALCVLAVSPPASRHNYIALGDSFAYGFTTLVT